MPRHECIEVFEQYAIRHSGGCFPLFFVVPRFFWRLAHGSGRPWRWGWGAPCIRIATDLKIRLRRDRFGTVNKQSRNVVRAVAGVLAPRRRIEGPPTSGGCIVGHD